MTKVLNMLPYLAPRTNLPSLDILIRPTLIIKGSGISLHWLYISIDLYLVLYLFLYKSYYTDIIIFVYCIANVDLL